MNFNFFEKWKKVKKEIAKVIEKEKFPCSSDNCLVRAACTKPCEKIIMNDDKLKDAFLEYNCCPDCGSETFMEGPSGGMSTNVKCGGCTHWFNMGLPMFIQRIHIANGVFH